MISGDFTPTPEQTPPAPATPAAPASLKDCHDLADTLAYLCAKYGATYERATPKDEVVRITLQIPGEGLSTSAAVRALLKTLGEVT